MTNPTRVFARGALAIFTVLAACSVKAGNPKTPDGKMTTVWIDKRDPRGATADTIVTLTGRSFGKKEGKVHLGSAEGTVRSWSDEEIKFLAPVTAQESCAPMRVETADHQQSNVMPLPHGEHDVWIPGSDLPPIAGPLFSVWTGTEMIVGGGGTNFVSRYNPKTDSWVAAAAAPAGISVTYSNVMKMGATVWTGSRLVYVGFSQDPNALHVLSYYPTVDHWETIVPPAHLLDSKYNLQGNLSVVWTGDRVLVWGLFDIVEGLSGVDTLKAFGLELNPTTLQWKRFDPPVDLREPRTNSLVSGIGKELLVWGGFGGVDNSFQRSGAIYNPDTGVWRAVSPANGPLYQYPITAWTGSRLLVWGDLVMDEQGVYQPQGKGVLFDPVVNKWLPMNTVNSLPAGASWFWGHGTSVWTGTQFLVWAPHAYDPSGRTMAAYDPNTDTWTPLSSRGEPSIASGGEGMNAVWNGTEMLVWFNNRRGFAYSPTTQKWRAIASSKEPFLGWPTTTFWTGTDMIVWGGWDFEHSRPKNGGTRYNPVTNDWYPLSLEGAPPPSFQHSSVWTGQEMIVWGGTGDEGKGECIFGSGVTTSTCITHFYFSPIQTGGAYNPATDSWRPLAITPETPSARLGAGTVWTGRRMVVWGGATSTPVTLDTYAAYNATLGDGATYDPATDRWEALPVTGAPSPRAFPALVWTGKQIVVWGGASPVYGFIHPIGQPFVRGDGAKWTPGAAYWTPVTSQGAPIIDDLASVWTGDRLLVGGITSDRIHGGIINAGTYDPQSDRWDAIASANGLPLEDFYGFQFATHSNYAWTGDELMIFGASYRAPYSLMSGYAYSARKNKWRTFGTTCYQGTYAPPIPVKTNGNDLLIWNQLIGGVWHYFP